jgi:VRR-NUC domain
MAISSDCIPPLSEKQFMAQVVDLARWCGYLVYHPYDSRRSEKGYPDLTMVNPGCDDRPGRIIFAELKTNVGRVSPPQRQWLQALSGCPGVECYLWRPRDWPAIVECLKVA